MKTHQTNKLDNEPVTNSHTLILAIDFMNI